MKSAAPRHVVATQRGHRIICNADQLRTLFSRCTTRGSMTARLRICGVTPGVCSVCSGAEICSVQTHGERQGFQHLPDLVAR